MLLKFSNQEKMFNILPLISLGERLKSAQIPSETLNLAYQNNEWFNRDAIFSSLESICTQMLDSSRLEEFCGRYGNLEFPSQSLTIICAGNIPFVAFADVVYGVLCGCQVFVKYSSKDYHTMKWLVEQLNCELSDNLKVKEYQGQKTDKVIATGSANSNRYFQYNFASAKSLFRSSRSSVAIIDKKSTKDDIIALWGDVFLYYGLGCRNVSLLLVEEGVDVATIWNIWQQNGLKIENSHFLNCYKQLRAVATLEKSLFFDGGCFLATKSDSLFAPLGSLNYSYYSDNEQLTSFLNLNNDKLQCVVGKGSGNVAFGSAQAPLLSDFADGVDVVDFLRTF